MHWQHLSTQYDELSYCFDGLPHESSSTIFASSKRISKLGWLAIYTQWVQILYEKGFSFFRCYSYNMSNPKIHWAITKLTNIFQKMIVGCKRYKSKGLFFFFSFSTRKPKMSLKTCKMT